jgi:hypothetical protein
MVNICKIYECYSQSAAKWMYCLQFILHIFVTFIYLIKVLIY